MKMKLAIFGIAAMLVAFSVFYDMDIITPPPPASEAPVTQSILQDKPLPEVTFTGLDGQLVRLEDYAGKVVLLNFWASWCPPCIKEFPSMLRLLDKFGGKVQLVAVSNDDAPGNIQAFLEKFSKQQKRAFAGPEVTIVWDKGQRITYDTFNTARFPETVIISPQQRMVRKVVGGEMVWDDPEMVRYIEKLLVQ